MKQLPSLPPEIIQKIEQEVRLAVKEAEQVTGMTLQQYVEAMYGTHRLGLRTRV